MHIHPGSLQTTQNLATYVGKVHYIQSRQPLGAGKRRKSGCMENGERLSYKQSTSDLQDISMDMAPEWELQFDTS